MIVVVVIRIRSERHAAENLGKSSRANGEEPFLYCHRSVCVAQPVCDRHQFVRTRALIAYAADRRSDRPDRDRTVVVHAAGDPSAILKTGYVSKNFASSEGESKPLKP